MSHERLPESDDVGLNHIDSKLHLDPQDGYMGFDVVSSGCLCFSGSLSLPLGFAIFGEISVFRMGCVTIAFRLRAWAHS